MAPQAKRSSRFVVAVAAALMVAQFSAPPTPAVAAPAESRVALPETPVTPLLRAASGAAIIADLQPDSGSLLRVTTDSGATWKELDAPDFASGTVGYAGSGKVVYYSPYAGSDNDVTRLRRYDFATAAAGAVTELPVAEPDGVGRDFAVYHTTSSGEASFFAQAYDGGAPVPLHPGEAAAAGAVVALGSGANALFVTGAGTASGELSLVPLDGGDPVATAPVSRLRTAGLRGDQAVYVQVVGKQAKLCFRDLAQWGTPRCWTVPGLSAAKVASASFTLGVEPDWVLLSAQASSGSGLGDFVASGASGGVPVPVRAGATTTVVAVGDSPRPLATVGTASSGYVGVVGVDGRVRRSFGNPTAPVAVGALALGATQLVSLDNRASDGYQVATRTVDGLELDAETLSPRTGLAVGASAGRTLLDTGSALVATDAGSTSERPLPKYGADAASLSGPYHLSRTVAYDEVTRADGKVLRRGTFKAIFGSLALRLVNATRNRYDVVDVVSGNVYPVSVPALLSPRTFAAVGLWGDYVVGAKPATASGEATAAVIDYRAGRTFTHPGLPYAWGDGYVVLSREAATDAATRFTLWDFHSGTATDLADGDIRAFATDGTGRIAYATARQLVLRRLDGVGGSAPRLLGVVAESTINTLVGRSLHLRLDATKPLAAGTAEIFDATGAVVRTLTFAAAADGSVRDLVWDGRDAAGQPVALGRYSWRVRAAAADGSGDLLGPDGSAVVAGGVRVVGSLGTARPMISDVTPRVGQRLRAATGPWSPAGVKLSYRWYRASASGNLKRVGSGASYRVQAGDKGSKLRVKVTGVLDGYDTASLWSARTAKVKRHR